MARHWMVTFLMFAAALGGRAALFGESRTLSNSIPTPSVGKQGPGRLEVIGGAGGPTGSCPLKHTEVKAEISGFLSRVHVTQEFENPFPEKIEAVYTFPLPQQAAVDDLRIAVGQRTIRGIIKRREEAVAIYEAARREGHVAALLNQERPNIFTQAVANIMPGEQIQVMISYVETLRYENGTYEFVFPMVVGPRYIPGSAAIGKRGGGWSPDTDQVPDASRITPPVMPEGIRTGHDLSFEISLDAGVPIEGLRSIQHVVEIARPSATSATVRLKDGAVVPNKDFILKYDVAGSKVQDALLSHRSSRGGFFSLILQPPERVGVRDVTPKELVFVLDTSGSMSGFPIEKAKETMNLALQGLYSQDTFNLITFSGDTSILFPQPVPATPANLKRAQAFLASREGGGGTEMMKAIRAALEPSDAQDHVRIVCFMTDGYVGNDMEIISEVQKHPNARVFSFGIGSSVNRYLLDKMAACGRGEAEYVMLSDDGSEAARRFHERVRNPLITDLAVDWGNMPVADIYPEAIPDLFSAKPIVVTGRYSGPWNGTIRLTGKQAGRKFARVLPVALAGSDARHDVLATLWARKHIEYLMDMDLAGIQQATPRRDIQEAITQTGLDYRLMTPYTSFVAVEELTVTDQGSPRRIEVPVEMPEGMKWEGVFGVRSELDKSMSNQVYTARPTISQRSAGGKAGGVPGGIPGGVIGGVISDSASIPPPPEAGLGSGRESDRIRGDFPAEQRLDPPASKLHSEVANLIDRLKRKVPIQSQEARFVKGDRAELRITLVSKSKAALEKLKELGFEVIANPRGSNFVLGRLPLDRLEALAKLEFIRYIAPM